MGVQPLPADLRKLCDCTGGSEKTWQGPEKRIWLRWPNAPALIYPQLASGILMELPQANITVQVCVWDPLAPIAPLVTLILRRTGQSPSTGTGFSWAVNAENSDGEDWVGSITLPAASTPQATVVNRFAETWTPPLGVPCILTQVRWYQNADDVPH